MKALEKVTGHKRYHPEDFEEKKKLRWSNELYVTNIFRAYEWLCGRGYGIRLEASANIARINNVDHIIVEFHTAEALAAHIEYTLRYNIKLIYDWTKAPLLTPVPRPVYLTIGLFGLFFHIKTSSHLLPLFGLAIAFDTSDGTHTTSAGSASFSYTVTGSNPFLAATIGQDDTTTGGRAVSTATYNSVTLVDAVVDGNNNTNHKHTKIWYLKAPATGANTLAVTLAAQPSTIGVIGVISLSGADQTTPRDTGSGSSAASGTTQSLTNSAASTGEWQVSVLAQDAKTLSDSTNQTTRWNNITNGFTHIHGGAAALAGSGSQAVVWTTSQSCNYAMSVMYVNPATVTVPVYFDHNITISQPILDTGIAQV